MQYIIAIIGIIGLMVLWVLIQGLWRKAFLEQQEDSDVLAGRMDCGSCGCGTPCKVKKLELKK